MAPTAEPNCSSKNLGWTEDPFSSAWQSARTPGMRSALKTRGAVRVGQGVVIFIGLLRLDYQGVLTRIGLSLLGTASRADHTMVGIGALAFINPSQTRKHITIFKGAGKWRVDM